MWSNCTIETFQYYSICIRILISKFLKNTLKEPDFAFQKTVEALFQRLGQKASTECYISCLTSIRILGRDKDHMKAFSSCECLDLLLHHSGILEYAEQLNQKIFTLADGDMNGKLMC